MHYLLFTLLLIQFSNPALASSDRVLDNDLEIWTESSLKKVDRNASPPRDQTQRYQALEIKMAQNEYESLQLIVKSKKDLNNIEVSSSDLLHADNKSVISQDSVSINAIGYVEPKFPLYRIDKRVKNTHWPDPLLPNKYIDLEDNRAQPFWITIRTDSSTKAGRYRGELTISIDNKTYKTLPLNITVWNFTLPKVPSLKSSFSIYENRFFSSYQTHFPEWWAKWKDRVPEYLEIFYEQLIRYKLAPNLNIDPLRLDTIYHHEIGMEDLLEVPELSFFEPLFPKLIDSGLSTFAIGPYAGTFGNNWPKESQRIEKLPQLYKQYAARLKDLNLLERHYIYAFDEPVTEDLPKVLEITTLTHQADKDLINLVTINTTSIDEQLKYLKETDIVVYRNRDFNPEHARQLQSLGKEVWFYVSSPKPPFPSLTIDYPPSAYRILPWMCWHYQLSGLLYWSVNYWYTNLYENPDNTPWGGQYGSGALFYQGEAGPVPSIRLEVLRDGFEDHDYLALIQAWVDQEKNSDSNTQLLAEARELLDLSDYIRSMSDYEQETLKLKQWREQAGTLLAKVNNK